MDKNFTYESKRFKTQSDMKKELRKLKKELCLFYGYDRDQIRIPHGLILLRGYSINTNCFLNLTSTISDYKNYIKNDDYIEYYLYCNVTNK